MKTFLYTFFLTLCTVTFAQDGLINLDDIANEKARLEEAAKKEAEATKQAELKEAQKKAEEAAKKEAEAAKQAKLKAAQEAKKTELKKTTPKANTAPASKEETSLPIVPILAGLIAALIAIIFVLKSKVSKKSQAIKPQGLKAQENTTEAPKAQTPPKTQQLPPQTLPNSSQGDSSAASAGSPEYIKENTALDEKGRNPSGIVIDEDKYFDGDASSFVDEDFQK